MRATVIGAGLAGAEAAWQLARRGIEVRLIDRKPERFASPFENPDFAELVCSNSLRSNALTNAVGLLKEEMRQLSSLILRAADATQVPAGTALAVSRNGFAAFVTEALRSHPHITVVCDEVEAVPEGPCIVATGPLTDGRLAEEVAALSGMETLHFFDAVAPIVLADSLDMERIYRRSRYDRGSDDYLNCPMTKDEYHAFTEALIQAECAPMRDFDEGAVFEGCMPIESMAKRGLEVMAHGPLKPVGLADPRTGRLPYAVVQLRQDDAAASLFNIVGFQTRLKFPEQKRVFSMIPGLEQAQFVRYGVMHRNTFLHSPGVLDNNYRMCSRDDLYFAGQLTGVEGYVESAASGMTAGVALARQLLGQPPVDFTPQTAIGALGHYISTPNSRFQPMNVNFGIIEPLSKRIKNKQERYLAIAQRSLDYIEALRENPLA